MTLQKRITALAVAGLMAGAAPIAVVAQTQQTAPPIEEVTGDEVEAFVAAYKDVQEVEAEYSAQMAETTDDDELMNLQQEAQVKQTEAVEAAEDISVERFVEILTVAQTDPEISAQIVEKLEQ